MQVQGRAQRERLVTAIADEPVELTDAAPKVRLTPDLRGQKSRLHTDPDA